MAPIRGELAIKALLKPLKAFSRIFFRFQASTVPHSASSTHHRVRRVPVTLVNFSDEALCPSVRVARDSEGFCTDGHARREDMDILQHRRGAQEGREDDFERATRCSNVSRGVRHPSPSRPPDGRTSV